MLIEARVDLGVLDTYDGSYDRAAPESVRQYAAELERRLIEAFPGSTIDVLADTRTSSSLRLRAHGDQPWRELEAAAVKAREIADTLWADHSDLWLVIEAPEAADDVSGGV